MSYVRASRMPAMSEAALQAAVLDLCRLRHLLVHHCRPARMPSGQWATPIQGDAGFPDLVIAGRRGLLLRELKSEHGQVEAGQAVWANRLEVARVDFAVWRPSDLASGRIATELGAIT